MSPCNGLAVTTAHINFNVGEHFQVPANREQFRAFLAEQGINVKGWWPLSKKRGQALGIGSDWTGLAFDQYEIKVSDENSEIFERTGAECGRAYGLAQVYIGQQIQASVVKTLQEMGLEPRDMVMDNAGTLEVRINVGPGVGAVIYRETARVKIALDGSLTLVTEDGQFEAGKKKLQILLGLLSNQLENATIEPSNEFESHRHSEAYVLEWQQA